MSSVTSSMKKLAVVYVVRGERKVDSTTYIQTLSRVNGFRTSLTTFIQPTMASMLLRSVYARRALVNPNLQVSSCLSDECACAKINILYSFQLTAFRALSSVPQKANPHGWKSWKDIPDSALPPCPDPTNGIYETERYKRVQKKRIWYKVISDLYVF